MITRKLKPKSIAISIKINAYFTHPGKNGCSRCTWHSILANSRELVYHMGLLVKLGVKSGDQILDIDG
ncbi:hypothetical protein EB796_001448 [Bugula neritina]|uniref:Uncharacterized protein n=1 Tax=Bugula neritina TaxID=10212 RepID=A0A7J7KPW8_BUGNE|nr:hypothetical protein EB796_001448 [Bugula neritina]